jgi:hypothetical protein
MTPDMLLETKAALGDSALQRRQLSTVACKPTEGLKDTIDSFNLQKVYVYK